MTILRIQTRIQHASGIAENDVTNTLYADVDAADAVAGDPTLLAIVQAVKNFYEVAHNPDGTAGGTSLKSHFSSELSTGANHIFFTKVYRMSDAIPRVPIHDERWASAVAGATEGLPAEVALVLSFQAARISGANQAHRRGRIFFGPIKKTSSVMAADNVVRPTQALMDSGLGAMTKFRAEVLAAGVTSFWSVYSPYTGGDVKVDNGWVDNAFDTQRRRGARASAKNLWG